MPTKRNAPRSRRGLTMIELLVVIAIIGLLMAVMLPAINAARQAVLALQCKNNLRQVGVALNLYVDTHCCFPPTNNNTSWSVSITPFVDQKQIFYRYDHTQQFDSAPNLPLGAIQLAAFTCPSEQKHIIPPTNLVAGNIAVNVELSGLAPAAVTDGLSNTGLAVEITSGQNAAWSSGPAILLGPQPLPHGSVLNLVRADGSVVGINKNKLDLLSTYGSPSGGETSLNDW